MAVAGAEGNPVSLLMGFRNLKDAEQSFLLFLFRQSGIRVSEDWQTRIKVEPMDEGGMGSLILHPGGTRNLKRDFGSVATEYTFKDADGAEVLATLNLDEKGELFELDIWKTTFDPLIRFPEI